MAYLPATEFCTQEQISNLHKLLDFLKSGKSKTSFNMVSYSYIANDAKDLNPEAYLAEVPPQKVENECGTVCCLAGNGPLAGILPLPNEDWGDYADRVFTTDHPPFYFLFDPKWADHQPTKEQALFRLELFLKKGLPENLFSGEYLKVWKQHEDFTNECKLGLHTLA